MRWSWRRSPYPYVEVACGACGYRQRVRSLDRAAALMNAHVVEGAFRPDHRSAEVRIRRYASPTDIAEYAVGRINDTVSLSAARHGG